MTRLALGVWACYAQLEFSPARGLEDADFIVIFSPQEHEWFNHRTKTIVQGSDGYPFDGPGSKSILLCHVERKNTSLFEIPNNIYVITSNSVASIVPPLKLEIKDWTVWNVSDDISEKTKTAETSIKAMPLFLSCRSFGSLLFSVWL